MPSAVAFLPPIISEFMNFATSLSLNLGSGMMRRLATSRWRDMAVLPLGLRSLHAVLRALAVAGGFVGRGRTRGAGGVERPADHVVANARQILHAASADEHDRVLLKVVTLAGDVARHFHAVGEAHAADLAECRVRFLRRRGVHAHADSA